MLNFIDMWATVEQTGGGTEPTPESERFVRELPGAETDHEAVHDPLEKIARILVEHYPPIEIIEHKYRTKITAVGLLRSAGMRSPEYIDYYYQRLLSYKLLVKDHVDNMRLSLHHTLAIFKQIILTVYHKAAESNGDDDWSLDYLISLANPEYLGAPERKADRLRRAFLRSMEDPEGSVQLAVHIMRTYLSSRDMYDLLAQQIIRCCLTGVKKQDIDVLLSRSKYNFFVYVKTSKEHMRVGFEMMLRSARLFQPRGLFTKIPLLARAVINEVGEEPTIVCFFGPVYADYEAIRDLFAKQERIRVLFF